MLRVIVIDHLGVDKTIDRRLCNHGVSSFIDELAFALRGFDVDRDSLVEVNKSPKNIRVFN